MSRSQYVRNDTLALFILFISKLIYSYPSHKGASVRNGKAKAAENGGSIPHGCITGRGINAYSQQRTELYKHMYGGH